MVVIEHRPTLGGWEFLAGYGSVQGGGRTLQDSKESAEHSVRQFLTWTGGLEVTPEQAHRVLCHVVCDESPTSRTAPASPMSARVVHPEASPSER